jgi:hypothetical protein
LEDLFAALFSGVFSLAWLVFTLAAVVGMWKAFEKAGQPGWAAIVPIYNIVIVLEIAGAPLWWLLLYFIPGVNFVVAIIVMMKVARAYGQGDGFGLGLAFLSSIFWMILGFGDSRYSGPVD